MVPFGPCVHAPSQGFILFIAFSECQCSEGLGQFEPEIESVRSVDVPRLWHPHQGVHHLEGIGSSQMNSAGHQVNFLAIDRDPIVVVLDAGGHGCKAFGRGRVERGISQHHQVLLQVFGRDPMSHGIGNEPACQIAFAYRRLGPRDDLGGEHAGDLLFFAKT
jgi:hypothetical protein